MEIQQYNSIIVPFDYSPMNKLFTAKTYPPETRKPTDLCCVVFLAAIIVMFFGFTGYIIIQGIHSYKNNSYALQTKYPYLQGQRFTVLWTCLTMAGIGIKLTFLFFLIAKILPKILMHFTVLISIGTLITIAALGKIYKHDKAALVSTVGLFLYLLFLFHSFLFRWDTISTFIKLTGKILKSNWKIFTIPFTMGVLGIIFTASFILSILSILQLYADGALEDQEAMLVIGIQGLFYSILVLGFYYAMVFLVSTNILFRYFQTNIEKSCMGIRWLLKYHLGSLILSSFIMPIAKVLSVFVDFISGICPSESEKNFDIAKPITFKSTIHNINNCSISLMSFTGTNLIQSSHLISLLSSQYPSLHNSVRKANNFLMVSGIINCCVLPSFIGYIVIQKFRHVPMGMFVSIIVMIISFLSVTISLSVLTESMTAGLIFAQIQNSSQGMLMSHINVQDKQLYQQLFSKQKSIDNRQKQRFQVADTN